MTNDEMVAGRFARWQTAKRKLAFVLTHLAAGRTVQIATALRVTRYSRKHAAMFRATRRGFFVQHGTRWDCADYCDLRAY